MGASPTPPDRGLMKKKEEIKEEITHDEWSLGCKEWVCGGKREFFISKKIVYLLVLFTPLVGAMVSGLFGRKIGERGAGILTSSCLIISLS